MFGSSNMYTKALVYGYSENRQTCEAQQQTDQLLSKLTSRIVDGATGLRLIVGDWNLERDQIAQADYWETKGWMEAQHFAHRKWNRPIQQCTCKKTTIKDYAYLSPERCEKSGGWPALVQASLANCPKFCHMDVYHCSMDSCGAKLGAHSVQFGSLGGHGMVDCFFHIGKIGGLSKSLKNTMMAAWSVIVLQSN